MAEVVAIGNGCCVRCLAACRRRAASGEASRSFHTSRPAANLGGRFPLNYHIHTSHQQVNKYHYQPDRPQSDIMKLLLLSTSILSTTAFQHAFAPRTLSSLSPLRLSNSSPLHSPPRPKNANALYMSSDVKQETSSGGGGTASIPNEIFNLVKSIVGAGVLSLPAGTLLFHICW